MGWLLGLLCLELSQPLFIIDGLHPFLHFVQLQISPRFRSLGGRGLTANAVSHLFLQPLSLDPDLHWPLNPTWLSSQVKDRL